MGGARGPDRGLTDGEMRERIAELRAGVDATAAVLDLSSWVTRDILVKVRPQASAGRGEDGRGVARPPRSDGTATLPVSPDVCVSLAHVSACARARDECFVRNAPLGNARAHSTCARGSGT